MSKIPREKYMFPDMNHNPKLVKMATCKSHADAGDVDLDIILTHACHGEKLSKNCMDVTKDAVSNEKPIDQPRNFCEFNWHMGTYKPWQSVDIMKQIAGPGSSGWQWGYVNLAPDVWQTLESWDLTVAVNSKWVREVREIIIRGIDVVQLYNAYMFPPLWMVAEDPRSSSTTGLFVKNGIVGATNGHRFVLSPGSAVIVQGSQDSKCSGLKDWERNRIATSFLVANGTVRLGANSKLMVAGPHTSLVLTTTNDSDIVIPPNVSICVCNGDEDHTHKYRAEEYHNGGHGSIILHSDAIKDLTSGWNYLFNLPNVAAYGPKGTTDKSWNYPWLATHYPFNGPLNPSIHPFCVIRERFKAKPGDKDPFVDPTRITVEKFVSPFHDPRHYYSLFVRYTGENPPGGFVNCCLDLFRGTSVTEKKKKAGVRDIMDAVWKNSKSTFDSASCPLYQSPSQPITSTLSSIRTGPNSGTTPMEENTDRDSPTTTPSTATTMTQKPSLPTWVIPMSAALGGLLLVGGGIVLAVVCWKRSPSASGTSDSLWMKLGVCWKRSRFVIPPVHCRWSPGGRGAGGRGAVPTGRWATSQGAVPGGRGASSQGAVPGGRGSTSQDTVPGGRGATSQAAVSSGRGGTSQGAVPGGHGAGGRGALPAGRSATSQGAVPRARGATSQGAVLGGRGATSQSTVPGGRGATSQTAVSGGRGATSQGAVPGGRGATSQGTVPGGRGATSQAAVPRARGATSQGTVPGGRGATSQAAVSSGRGATSQSAVPGGHGVGSRGALPAGRSKTSQGAVPRARGATSQGTVPGGRGATSQAAVSSGRGATSQGAVPGGHGAGGRGAVPAGRSATSQGAVQRGRGATSQGAVLGGRGATSQSTVPGGRGATSQTAVSGGRGATSQGAVPGGRGATTK